MKTGDGSASDNTRGRFYWGTQGDGSASCPVLTNKKNNRPRKKLFTGTIFLTIITAKGKIIFGGDFFEI